MHIAGEEVTYGLFNQTILAISSEIARKWVTPGSKGGESQGWRKKKILKWVVENSPRGNLLKETLNLEGDVNLNNGKYGEAAAGLP